LRRAGRSHPPLLCDGARTAPAWEFSGRLEESGARPFGFDTKAAAAGVRYNGFHLFPCFYQEHLTH
jgi:hypothetical protein